MPTTREIQLELARYFEWWVNPVIPNAFLGRYEMDLAIINKSDYLIEVEIKRSLPDFYNDFEKGKWQHLNRRQFYFAAPHELAVKLVDLVPTGIGVLSVFPPKELHYSTVKELVPATRWKVDKLTPEKIQYLLRKQNFRYWNLAKHGKNTCESRSFEDGEGI